MSCNGALRAALIRRCSGEGVRLLLTDPALTTDNAAMIAHVAGYRHAAGLHTDLAEDVDPNLPLASR